MRQLAAFVLTIQAAVASTESAGGIVTLYSLDPIASSLSFQDGGYGRMFQDDQAKNRSSDLDFDWYAANAFSVGVEGRRVGAIVDLGSARELSQRYGYEETVGAGQGFASLRIVDGRIVILRSRRENTVQPLKEASALAEAKPGARAAIVKGHIYLARVTNPDDATRERIAKILVLDHQPGASVTFRWSRLK